MQVPIGVRDGVNREHPVRAQALLDLGETRVDRVAVDRTIDHNVPDRAMEVCRTIASQSEVSGVPVLVVTDGGSVELGKDAGASHVLPNSSLLTDLSSIVRHLLEESTALIYVLEEVSGRVDALVRGLRGKGFIVIPHSSSEALRRAIEQQQPRMLMLDITRGVERLCQQLKNDSATSQCPIVLTAEGSVASSREAHIVGADYYLTKAGDAVTLAAMLLTK